MCGIAGIVQKKEGDLQRVIEQMTDMLTHRGPDGRGVHIDQNVALGHRRL
jgi:asparagine synthase (glutamine-hydrolysing)